MNKEDKEIEEVKKRFKPLPSGNQLFEYKIDGIKEIFKINVIDTGNPNATIRITPAIYKENGTAPVLDLPLSEISPQFDLKNTLINELIKTLKDFKESLFNTPIDKPGIQHFIMLKLSLLMDMPRICWLFLRGDVKREAGKIHEIYNNFILSIIERFSIIEKLLRFLGITPREDYSEYNLSDEPKINAMRVHIFSHNIGGFLKDEKVRAVLRDMGKKEKLDEQYDQIADAKVTFLRDNFNYLNPQNIDEEMKKLGVWFGEKYRIGRYWKTLYISELFGVGIVFLIIFLLIYWPLRDVPQYLIPGFQYAQWLALTIGVIFSLIGIYKMWRKIKWKGIFKKLLFRPIIVFEMHNPRLLVGIFTGTIALFGFESALWKVAVEGESLLWVSITIIILLFMYFWTKFTTEKIGGNTFYRFCHTMKILAWTLYLSGISVGVSTLIIGKFFIRKLDNGQYEMCPQLLLFWIIFSVLVGVFMQLFWQKEKITEPI